jgi:metabolite-proton symporter
MSAQPIAAAAPTPPKAPVKPLRIALASFIGTAVEWYDYFIYGTAAAIVFGPLFFPKFSAAAGTMAAFATFSVGFLARPLGAVVMGHFGDRLGRKSMLVVSLLTIGLATTCIGLLPTYASVGVLAPALLVALRFLQGIGVGGEWGGAVLLAVEHAPPKRKGFYGSFPQMGVPAGLILANLVFLAVSGALGRDAFLAWGWRVPFLASALLVVIGLVIRFKVAESPDFERLKRGGERERRPLVAVLKRHPAEVLLGAGALVGNSAVGYIFMAYLLSYGTTVLGLSRNLLLTSVLIGALAWLAAIPWASGLSDRHGRARVLLAGSVGLTVVALGLFALVNTRSPALIVTALVAAGVFLGITYGPLAALMSELFPANVRYSGASLAYQIGAVVGGGIAPTVAAGLFRSWGSSLPITAYLAAVCVFSLACVAAIGRRSARS